MKRLTCFALALALSLGAPPALAADKLRVLLDWFVNPDHAALIIARDKGFFAKQGLEVELIAPADPNAPPKLLAAGQADLAISYQPQLHILVDAGLPLMRVGVLVAQPLSTVIVLADGPVKTVADLKGRKIGYSVGGFEEAILGAMLEKAGLTMKDVTLVNVNFNLSASLLAKQVDAVVGGYRNFEVNQLDIEKHPGRAFLVEQHGVPPYDELIVLAHRTKRDNAKIKRFLVAVGEATTWLAANSEEGWKIFAKSGKELDNELNRRAWRDTLPLLARNPQALDRARYAAFAEFLKARKLIKAIAPIDSYAVEIR